MKTILNFNSTKCIICYHNWDILESVLGSVNNYGGAVSVNQVIHLAIRVLVSLKSRQFTLQWVFLDVF